MLTHTDLQLLIPQGEGQHIEFKQSFSARNEIIETLGAFANSQGGSVLVGISNDATVVGVTLGENTLERFANYLHDSTDPPLYPSIIPHEADGKTVVAVSMRAPRQGELFYAFRRPFIRVGKTNQVMSPQEQKEKLLGGQIDWTGDRECPRFDLPSRDVTWTDDEFELNWELKQVAGDYLATIEWRYRGGRLNPLMEWQRVSGAQLSRGLTCSAFFYMSEQPGQDEQLLENQIGFEVRFDWRGQVRHELHKYSLTKALWNVGIEILPPQYRNE